MDVGLLPHYDAPTLQGLNLEAGQDGLQVKQSNRQSVRFYTKQDLELCAVLNPEGTKVARYEPIPVSKLMVRIETPGDKNIFDDVANEYHKREYKRYYYAFKDGKGAPVGHALEDCDYIQPVMVTELKYEGIHTMEQLADAPDNVLDRLPLGRPYQHYAQQWCQINSPTGVQAVAKKLTSDLSSAKSEIESLREQFQKQSREISRLKMSMVDGDGRSLEAAPLITEGVALPEAMEERPEAPTIEMTPEEFKAKRNKK